MVKHGFSAGEVLKLSGLTYRQLDYWASSDFITPSIIEKVGLRTKRIYTFTDILAIRAAMRLLDAGIPLQGIRKAVNRLQLELTSKKEVLHSLVWLTDGENLFVLEDRNMVRNVLNDQYAFAFAVNVGQLADKLEDDVKVLNRQSKRKRRYQYPDLAVSKG